MKYNEQHAMTMLNALQGTETLKEHDEQVKEAAIDEFYNLLINHTGDISDIGGVISEQQIDTIYEQLKKTVRKIT